jgi:bis(5'-nucleosyl)-tetraphosphatase (symmetrical)
VRQLGGAALSVLGNHDLHLLAVARGDAALKHKDTLRAVLDAPDAAELLDWLQSCPLLHHDPLLGWTLLHAGLPPAWDLATAQGLAREVEALLAGPGAAAFLAVMYGDQPARWSPALAGIERWRFVVNCLTRMRYVAPDGRLDLDSNGPPGTQPEGSVPWFDVPGRASRGTRIVCGHWSALGYLRRDDLLCLDSGCLWGGALTAQRLDVDDAPPVTVACSGALAPG